jgi:hypothetical protein
MIPTDRPSVSFTYPFNEILSTRLWAVMKLKSSKNLINNRAMQTYEKVEVSLHALTSALVGGEWSASRTDRFSPGNRRPR